MTDYTKLYEEKRMTPEQMAQFVQSGDKIASTTAMGEPPKILDAICDRALAEDLTDIKLYKLWMVPMGGKYTLPELDGHVDPVSLFAGGSEVRQMIGEGRADYIPSYLCQHPHIFRNIKPRIAVAMASPMDESGYFSF